MKNGHEAACDSIERILNLLETDQLFTLTISGTESGSEKLSLFFADSMGTLYEALKEMQKQHKAEA